MDVKDYSPEVLRSRIGIVPQKAVLFAGTIVENLRWGKKDASKEEMWKALEISQSKEFVEKKTDSSRAESSREARIYPAVRDSV